MFNTTVLGLILRIINSARKLRNTYVLLDTINVPSGLILGRIISTLAFLPVNILSSILCDSNPPSSELVSAT